MLIKIEWRRRRRIGGGRTIMASLFDIINGLVVSLLLLSAASCRGIHGSSDSVCRAAVSWPKLDQGVVVRA